MLWVLLAIPACRIWIDAACVCGLAGLACLLCGCVVLVMGACVCACMCLC